MRASWLLIDWNVALIVWIGIGGMMAAFAGPLVMGALWRGVTRAGAYAGLIAGFLPFVVLHTESLSADWFDGGVLDIVLTWLHGEGPNPFSCAAIGEAVAVATTFIVSKVTAPLPTDHIEEMFGKASES